MCACSAYEISWEYPIPNLESSSPTAYAGLARQPLVKVNEGARYKGGGVLVLKTGMNADTFQLLVDAKILFNKKV